MKPLLVAVALALSACQPFTTPAATANGLPTNLVLRTYEVPGNGAGQLRSVLMNTLWFGSDGKRLQQVRRPR